MLGAWTRWSSPSSSRACSSPLAIPRWPLVIVVVLVLDAVDQTLLATFTDVDTTETGPYQSVNKALDIYYLSIGYLATMRNWKSRPAFRVARFLLYYRLVGVVLFELTDERLMLFLFPNTFEFFFIAYELARLRYEPSRFSGRFWLLTAAALWMFMKLPQEYWIHIADRLHRHGRGLPGVRRRRRARAAGGGVRTRTRRLSAPAGARLGLAGGRGPAPVVDGGHARLLRAPARGRLRPDARGGGAGVPARAPVHHLRLDPAGDRRHAAPSRGRRGGDDHRQRRHQPRRRPRRGGFGLEAGEARYAALLATNLALVYVANALLGERRDFDLGYGLFFGFLITTIIWLYDAFRPVYDERFRA